MSTSVTKPGYTMTTQANSTETPEFAFFSDTLRDALRGSVFNNDERGYVAGIGGHTGTVAASISTTPDTRSRSFLSQILTLMPSQIFAKAS